MGLKKTETTTVQETLGEQLEAAMAEAEVGGEAATSGYSVDVVDFNSALFTHQGSYVTMEEAIEAANEIELVKGSMVRVTAISYLRVNAKD